MVQAAPVQREAVNDWDTALDADSGYNRLLHSLPPDEAAIIDSLLEPVDLETGYEIAGPGEPIEWVHFPDTAVLSLITIMAGGGGIESLTTGRDGLSGFALLTGCTTSFPRVVCQVPGRSRRAPASSFMDALPRMPELHKRVLRYSQLAFDVASQSAACNRVHVTEERCARWLLLSQDRAGRREFKLTQVFLAQMLGVRRPAVTVAIGILERSGLIEHRRGRIRVSDRDGLERASCECYGLIRARQMELMGF
ncbi:MAG TPA: Crp/Fnr family transcriptional regulator [Gemmatimonadaceae bacterium]